MKGVKMKISKPKIGWQKYENVIEEQLTSTFFSDILSNMIGDDTDQGEEAESVYYEESEDENSQNTNVFLAKIGINEKIFEDLGMIVNFDCWVGHTNFDITPQIKKELDSVQGIEVLKIFSRYRFFIGVGKMFNFKSVRNNIENLLLSKGDCDGHEYENRTGDEES
jgi:hypothetical protein